MKRLTYLILIFVLFATSSYAHPGRTDSQGGHYNRKTGEYHFHNNPPATSSTYTLQETNEAYLNNEDKLETVVYITKTGSKYHKGSCHYLRYSKFAIPKKEAIKKGYLPCKVCRP